MPFELARFNVPNMAAIVAMALLPLIALPMKRHQSATAKAQQIESSRDLPSRRRSSMAEHR